MDRSPLFLAALASAAVPGLDPASVEALPGTSDHQYDVAFVQDTQHRRWVIRVPRTQAAAAQMEATFGLLALLARRLPFSVPTPKGFAALKGGGRAAIYPYLPGQNLDFAALPAGPGLAAELGRSIAALHNTDHGLFDEAGLPAYDADTYRTRRLTELDRAAATGHVPTGLLTRWEKQLEDVVLWRFAPTPTHGDLTGDQVLVVFDDDQDASTGRVRAFTGWEDAKVADPADDFSALVTQASEGALETLMEAYAHARSERPDPHLVTRARLVAQMRALGELMAAVSGGDRLLVERHAATLRRLDEQLHAQDEANNDYRREALSAARPISRVVVPPVVDEGDDEDEDVAVMFARTADEDIEVAEADAGHRVSEDVSDAEVEDAEDEDEDGAEDAGTDADAVAVEAAADDSEPTDVAPTDEDAEATGTTDPDDTTEPDDAAVGQRGDVTTEIPVRTGAPAQPDLLEFDEDEPGPEHEPGYSSR
ncbi:phosphotransferase [Pedococcus sp. KACC 23699]|uniref:Phosphotransferase n=1 Tax=Pedococcus sp. KACC 23699 TaxID=3149228 RepID=A0AAU7JQJ1_9MICO